MASCLSSLCKSWDSIDQELKPKVLKEYFSTFINISGLFAGFQSFVINEYVSSEHLSFLQKKAVLLLMLSFGSNICACLTSFISHNAIVGGVYADWFVWVNIMCVFWIVSAIVFYICSFIIFTYHTFIYTMPFFTITLVLTGLSGLVITVFFGIVEYKKWTLDTDERNIKIKRALGDIKDDTNNDNNRLTIFSRGANAPVEYSL